MDRSIIAVAAVFCLVVNGQESAVVVERPTAPIVIRPWMPATVPSSRMTNSDRVRSLIRGGSYI